MFNFYNKRFFLANILLDNITLSWNWKLVYVFSQHDIAAMKFDQVQIVISGLKKKP